MTDRDLLELAAKAAGLFFHGHRQTVTLDAAWVSKTNDSDDWFSWNPLTDDGDALRLAVELGISITPYPIYRADERHAVVAKQRREGDMAGEMNPTEVVEAYGEDHTAATRRAIVRSAAEIGAAK